MSEVSNIETEAQAEEAVVASGVELSDGRVARAEGEGRQRRYYLGDENVAKGDVIAAVVEDDGADADQDSDDEESEHGDIACRVCGSEVGYLTGSHMKTHEDDEPQTVDEYRAMVAAEDDIDTSDVPLCTDEMMDVFKSAGDLDQETRDELAAANKARWEAGEYDHLRKEDDESEEADA